MNIYQLREYLRNKQFNVNMNFFTLVGLTACLYFFIYATYLLFSDCDLQLAFYEKFGKKLVKLRGRVIWITGASTELGRMMALEVTSARRYGKLILSSSFPAELQNLKTLCLEINPSLRSRDILVLKLDLQEMKSSRTAFKKVLRYFGKLDILIMIEDKWQKCSWEDSSEAGDRMLFQSNLFAVLSLSRLAVKHFNTKRQGKLAIISSIAGLIGVPYSSCYAATKHALHGYFNSLRFEKMSENIQPIILCLGSRDLLHEKCKRNEDEFLARPRRKKLVAKRCAHLCLTAIVNDLDEAWIAVFPILPLTYAITYYPNVTKLLLKYLKPKEINKSCANPKTGHKCSPRTSPRITRFGKHLPFISKQFSAKKLNTTFLDFCLKEENGQKMLSIRT